MFEAFVAQVGPTKASWITSISLRGSPNKEIELLVQLPRLQRLGVSLSDYEISRKKLRRFCNRLKELRLEVVPSLRYLFVSYERRWGLGLLHEDWLEVKSAVGVVKQLWVEPGLVEYHRHRYVLIMKEGEEEDLS